MGVLGGAGDARGAVPLRAPRAALGTGVFDSEKVLGLNPWPFSFPPCLSEEQFSKGCYLGMVNSDSQSNRSLITSRNLPTAMMLLMLLVAIESLAAALKTYAAAKCGFIVSYVFGSFCAFATFHQNIFVLLQHFAKTSLEQLIKHCQWKVKLFKVPYITMHKNI